MVDLWIDVDFGARVQLDRVEIHSSADQWAVDVKLEGVDASMQRLEDPPSDDMHGNPERWGLNRIADRGGAWLFQIQ